MGLLSWPKGRRVYQDAERLEYPATDACRRDLQRTKSLHFTPGKALPHLKADADKTPDAGLRLDQWLVFTRFFKTRALASRAVGGGHVRRNGERAKAGAKVAVGDCLEIVRGHERHEVEVRALPRRRGPANEARECYSESQRSIEQREATAARIKSDRMTMPRTPGRPDKHTRRLLRQRNRAVD
jgi:ribosome-associated heat shock protein Hsp15